jgi:nicotinamidase-related amidase
MPHPTQLQPLQAAVLIVDVQEKLMAKIPAADRLVLNMAFLIDAAALASVPVVGTEQYPKGLGPTVSDLKRRLPHRPEKLAFSCCAVPDLVEGFRRQGRTQIVVAGIESHVCVLNTVLDLLAEGMQPHLCVDAIGSRYDVDHRTAIERLGRAGAILTTVETAGFEWLGGSHHPRFKDYNALVQERMKRMTTFSPAS